MLDAYVCIDVKHINVMCCQTNKSKNRQRRRTKNDTYVYSIAMCKPSPACNNVLKVNAQHIRQHYIRINTERIDKFSSNVLWLLLYVGVLLSCCRFFVFLFVSVVEINKINEMFSTDRIHETVTFSHLFFFFFPAIQTKTKCAR